MSGLESRAEWEIGPGLGKSGYSGENSEFNSREDKELVRRVDDMGLAHLPGREALINGWGADANPSHKKLDRENQHVQTGVFGATWTSQAEILVEDQEHEVVEDKGVEDSEGVATRINEFAGQAE